MSANEEWMGSFQQVALQKLKVAVRQGMPAEMAYTASTTSWISRLA